MYSFYKYSLTLSLLFTLTATLTAQSINNVLSSKTKRIVRKLKKDDEVHFGFPVGFSGEPMTNNKYYKLYLKLKENATDEELVSLTKNNSKCIVIYSFEILLERQYANLKDIFLEHQNDTTFYSTAGGCTGMLKRVNWFMFRLLRPIEGNNAKNYMTKDEYYSFCEKFKKADKDFSCN